ncbi:hypothetical protein HPP92_011942 [Vanilla planifolia]|uniref:Filament-like plant protein n=1 Tax=Vanilla planifolia TaxID=51239 RepID=A0A835QYK7_VANPL|nr:hypothetical protein HPP92_011942 [Vanilla planifolia]
MDRRSWLWRRKSSEKSPGETESSGSVSSYSERYSEDQEVVRIPSVNASPNHVQSPEHSSKISTYEPTETIKSLNEKLSAALLSINCKEELVKQHAKVAEEAVSGWEKAEEDVATLKKQLEATLQKNSALEERTSQLDGALKECVRQLRHLREQLEQKVHEAVMKKSNEWENEKLELETQIIELQAKLEAKFEVASSIDHQLRLKFESMEKEKSSLQIELLSRIEDLRLRTLECDLSTQAAEAASKLHLESTKKVAKLEAECRKLRAANRKCLPLNSHFKPTFYEQKPLPSSFCVESVTDSQSDSGERLVSLDHEPSCSDSWASALIAELDQFKSEKASIRNFAVSSMEIDLMDDFLEMERLAGLPEAGCPISSFDVDSSSDHSFTKDCRSRTEVETVDKQMAELEQKVAKFEAEKLEMEMALGEAHNQLNNSSAKLSMVNINLIELQKQVNIANESKHILETQLDASDAKKKELMCELESQQFQISQLKDKVSFFEGKVEEKALSPSLESNKQGTVCIKAEKNALMLQLEVEKLGSKKLQEKLNFLEKELVEERQLSSVYLERCQDMETVVAKWKDADSQLASAKREINDLHYKVSTLEDKLKVEEGISAKFSSDLENTKENGNNLSAQLEMANIEAVKLKERIRTLEEEVEETRALSTEFATKCQHSQSQLSLALVEIKQLHVKVSSFERISEEERLSSAEFKAQAEADMEAARKSWESKLFSAHMEVEELHKKVSLLESEVEKERAISAVLEGNLERALLTGRKEMETQLDSSHLEVTRMQDKVASMQKEVDWEKSISAEHAQRCQKLEYELSRYKQEDELQGSITPAEALKLKQEKGFVFAAVEKFAACQKTIESLSRQLKSLSNFENLLIGPENSDCNMHSSERMDVDVNLKCLGYSLKGFDESLPPLVDGKGNDFSLS